jgi:hypothetical protein
MYQISHHTYMHIYNSHICDIRFCDGRFFATMLPLLNFILHSIILFTHAFLQMDNSFPLLITSDGPSRWIYCRLFSCCSVFLNDVVYFCYGHWVYFSYVPKHPIDLSSFLISLSVCMISVNWIDNMTTWDPFEHDNRCEVSVSMMYLLDIFIHHLISILLTLKQYVILS